MMIKNMKFTKLNMNIATAFLNRQTLKMILQNTNVYPVMRIIRRKLRHKLKKGFFKTFEIFLNMITKSLFYCC